MVFNYLKAGYNKLKNALAKSGFLLGAKLRSLFSKGLDEESLDQLEQVLYEADLGVATAQELTKKIQEIHRANPQLDAEGLINELKQELIRRLANTSNELISLPKEQGPLIMLIVGVNGNGKTTSVAKLAKRFKDAGQKVLVGAADTFRAAAIEQLDMWAQRTEVDIVKGAPKSDPAAVTFDTVNAGKSRGHDVIIIDTAGRLHTKIDLMQELEKIRRSCKKIYPDSPHETLLVLDATTGQNAVDQAKTFHKYAPITGLILTKMDGTAKGGIVLSIQKEVGVPVKFIGVGEGIEDIEPFDPEHFVNTLFA
jgi:fused signal recognition particle receptor